ncbi:MAG TPA: HAD family hydrolase [Chloroflexota bacterium]|nr:HAD family hydrolase [Chloroflexota bacterium]
MIQPLDAVLLDLYDTLAWADWPALEAGRAALAAAAAVDVAAFVQEMARTELERFRGRPGGLEAELAAVLGALGVSLGAGRLAELADLERATWSGGVHLYDDALPTIRELRRDRRVAIVSNCGYQTSAWIEALGLAREVDAVVLSCEVGALKPDPAIFHTALASVGVAPAHAALVDDVAAHLDASRALGLRTVQVVREGVARPPSDHPRIASLRELRRQLDG